MEFRISDHIQIRPRTLTDAIINGQKTNGATESYPWGEVFYPERKIVRSQYFANVKENVRENIKSFLTRKSKIND